MRVADRNTEFVSFAKFIRMLAQILIMAAGALQVLQGELSPGAMIAGSVMLGRALAPVEQSISGWSAVVGAREAWRRLNPSIPFSATEKPLAELPMPLGRVTFENLWFSPEQGAEPLIKGIDFAMKPGECVGIIGPTGAGKSTLFNLICGAWRPTHGSVKLDEIMVQHWGFEQRGRLIGVVPQDVQIFQGTIRENISRFDDTISMEQIINAAKQVGAHGFITSRLDGYETMVGEGEGTVSAGERQLIGLARGIVHTPPVLLMDEPHQHLSKDAKEALAAYIRASKQKGTTVVLCDPPPNTFHDIDTLLVLRSGMIQFAGPRDKVMDRLTIKSHDPG